MNFTSVVLIKYEQLGSCESYVQCQLIGGLRIKEKPQMRLKASSVFTFIPTIFWPSGTSYMSVQDPSGEESHVSSTIKSMSFPYRRIPSG